MGWPTFYEREPGGIPWRHLPAVGGKPTLHAVEPEEQAVWMDIGERVGHTLVLGTTRVGKTRLAEILITQDIRRGDVVIVFDPKGDAGLLKRIYTEAKRSGRAKDFYMFHLGYPEVSARYNAIGNFSRITEVATRIANQLPSEGNSAAFKEFAWRFVNIIARALVALKRRPDYQQVRRYINDIEPLFMEYARYYLGQQGAEDWEAQVRELAGTIKERNLPTGTAWSKHRCHRAHASSAGPGSLRPRTRWSGIGLQVRQDLFRQDRQLRRASDGETDHRQHR